jgi:hypothetical protein
MNISREEYIKNSQEITDWDIETYRSLVTTDITKAQEKRIIEPSLVFEKEPVIMGLHWHPEIVPLEMIGKRIAAMFPDKEEEFLIPTQHNEIMEYDGFSGVEVDCYSREFNRKVQLLLHFKSENLSNGDVLRSMLEHTFNYRASQFYDLMNSIIDPAYEERIEIAVEETGVDEELVTFVKVYAKKIMMLIDKLYDETPTVSIKNKLLPNFISTLDGFYDSNFINRALIFIKEVKRIVKQNFVLDYFYETNEIIEETRGLGGGVIVPHPEQFWPILLADYDVDGYEVWNPQSREFTEFLIQVVVKKNKTGDYREKPLLITMGDDTHMGEKLKEERHQKKEKASREIGLQPAWDDIEIRKSLILGNFDRSGIIDEYISRIS